MKSKTEIILTILNVLAWIAFIGLMVKAGAYLFSYVMTLFNTEASRNLYNGLSMYELRQFSFLHYTYVISLLVFMESIKAFTAYLLIRVLSKIKIENPFKPEIAQTLLRISYALTGLWVTAAFYNAYLKWLLQKSSTLQEILTLKVSEASGDFLFLIGVVFIIVQVFKKGVEIQNENELTV